MKALCLMPFAALALAGCAAAGQHTVVEIPPAFADRGRIPNNVLIRVDRDNDGVLNEAEQRRLKSVLLSRDLDDGRARRFVY